MTKKLMFTTAVAAVASLYFARADENKQQVISSLISGYELKQLIAEKNIKEMPPSQLMEDVRLYTGVAEDLSKAKVLCENGLGYFDTLNKLERAAAQVAVATQHQQVVDHVVALLDELKRRLV